MNKKANTQPKDAVALLAADHERVKAAFKEFEELGDRAYATKKKLADMICDELEIHALLEEEVFYPAVRKEAKKEGDELVDEAVVEHQSAKELIAQIRMMSPEDDLFDAKVKVLGEQIEHHVKEEEEEMFPEAEEAGIDLEELGQEMAARKESLQSQRL
ncbi:MAG: hemerythrin [Paucimonas sp.]|jgi:iron-sulfur cluster repair protein YtfE (RIC family)|nr:hemerythrin [Paucimonas sp.]